VWGVRRLEVKHDEGGFPSSGDEKLGRFKIARRGGGPLLDDRSERFKVTTGGGLCCISLVKPCLLNEGEEVGSNVIHDGD